MTSGTSRVLPVVLLVVIGAAITLARPTPDTVQRSRVLAPGASVVEPPSTIPVDALSGAIATDPMAAGGAAMIRAADLMLAAVAETSAAPATSGVDLAEFSRHWVTDAAVLRERGVRMTSSATADAMVHNLNTVHEINLYNLHANGVVMASQGQEMIDHGQAMISEIALFRDGGGLDPVTADRLTVSASALTDAGERLLADGRKMQR